MGLDRLIAAVAELVQEGLRFELVVGGSGPLRGALEQQAKEMGVAENVRFLGRVPDDVLPMTYAAADAFVLPTLALECFGLIAIEALATGRPVLATPVGAIPEVVRNFEAKWLATGASTGEIAGLLREFLQGRLPMHEPRELHERTRELYGRDRVLPRWIERLVRGRG